MRNRFSKTLVALTRLPFIGGKVKRWVENRFDALFQGWGERSWLFQSLQDAWLEIDAMSRMEAQRIHESLIENSPVVQKIRSLKLQFAVGSSGLKVIPESSDEGFNDARSISWENWWSRPELGSQISGAMLTRVWAGLLFDKGGIFVNLTSEKIQGKDTPRLQTIDCHRVKSPGSCTKDELTGFPVIDGVVIHPDTGARLAYYVRKADYRNTGNTFNNQTNIEQFDRIPAFDPLNPRKGGIVHKFKQLRPGQIRELPEGMSVFNLVRDNMDLHKLEMQAAKLASSIGPIETNPAGELDALANRKSKLQIQTQNIAGQSVQKTSWIDYNVQVGASKIALKTGSKLEDFMIHRPTVATQTYWDLHITFICVGYKVPKMLVMPYSLQGTVTRADLDICTAAFREDFELIRELCETIFKWQGEWDLKDNPALSGSKHLKKLQSGNSRASKEMLVRAERSRWVQDAAAPEDSHVCLIRPPRAPNVDIGYTAKALEIELRLGVRCPQDIFADKGQDWRTQTRQMAEYISYVNQLAKEFNLQPGQITSLATQQVIEDPTNKPDQPENPAPGGGESSPEARAVTF